MIAVSSQILCMQTQAVALFHHLLLFWTQANDHKWICNQVVSIDDQCTIQFPWLTRKEGWLSVINFKSNFYLLMLWLNASVISETFGRNIIQLVIETLPFMRSRWKKNNLRVW